MAEYYNTERVVVTDQAITVDGRSRSLTSVLRAEAYQVEDWLRNGIIFAVGCLAPIAAMVIFTQVRLVPQYLDDGHDYWFGPLVLISVLILGCLAAAIGHFWPKPWGVVIERPEHGHGRLLRTDDKQRAEDIAAAINKALEPSSVDA